MKGSFISPRIDAAERWVYVLGAGSSRDACFPLVRDILSHGYLEELFFRLSRSGVQAEFIAGWKSRMKDECDFFCAFGVEDAEQLFTRLAAERDTAMLRRLKVYLTCLFAIARDVASNHEAWAPIYRFLCVLVPWIPRVTLISFNYDLLFDWALKVLEIPSRQALLNYGFLPGDFRDTAEDEGIWMTSTNPISPPYTGSLPLLKLHGSLNWGYCERCKSLTFFRTEIESYYLPDTYPKICKECGASIDEPLIVPPMGEEIHPVLASVWTRAERTLEAADVVVFIGYSMPEYDDTAYKLFQSTCSDLRIMRKRVYVVCPRVTAWLRTRYASICRDVRFYEQSFAEYIEDEWTVMRNEVERALLKQ